MVARHSTPLGVPPPGPGAGGPVVIDLRERSLERYAYLLPRQFHEAGYAVHVRPRLDVIGDLDDYRGRYAKLVLGIPGVKVERSFSAEPSAALYVTDRPSRLPDAPWRGVLEVNYDWYGAPADALAAPYPTHPNQYESGAVRRLGDLRDHPRTFGALFAGNVSPDRYGDGPITEVFGLLPRAGVVAALWERTPAGQLFRPAPPPGLQEGKGTLDDLERIAGGGGGDRVVSLDRWRVHDDDWLSLLARAAFFVAPPGIQVPHSHNIVEAMAVGTVPITNYGHLMRPALTDREALLFTTADDLAACVRRALAMEEEERRAMRAAAAAYYDAHLAPASFAARLEQAVAESDGMSIPLYAWDEEGARAAVGRAAARRHDVAPPKQEVGWSLGPDILSPN
jgi:hypothetical protein